MSIDYAILHPTPPDDELGSAGRFELLRKRAKAEAMIRHMRDAGDHRPLSEITVTKALKTLSGVEAVQTTLQAMLDESAGLEAMLIEAGPHAVYESGNIAYPIQSNTEEWLMSLLPRSLESAAGLVLASLIEDYGRDGAAIARMRAAGPLYFARRKPVRRVWRTRRGEAGLTSDQLLQILFGVGPLYEPQVVSCALVFGLLPHDLSQDRFAELLEDPAPRAALLDHAPLPKAPDNARGLVRFLETLRYAAKLDAIVWIDA